VFFGTWTAAAAGAQGDEKAVDPEGGMGLLQLTIEVPLAAALVATIVWSLRSLAAHARDEARLRAFVGVTQSIVFEFDGAARYTHVWTEDAELLAAPASDMLGRTIDQVLGPEIGGPFTATVKRVLATGKPETFEYPLDVPSGRRWFLADVRPFAPRRDAPSVAFVARDITRMKAAEAALRQSEANFRTLIENSPDAILVDQEGLIVYANRALATVVDVPVDELRGRGSLSLVAPEDRERARATREHPVSPLVHVNFTRADGGRVLVEARAMQITFDGAPCNVIVARDVTETTQMREKLALAERMAALGTLAAGTGHEINNPLAFVLSNLDYALPQVEGDLADALRDAHDGAMRIRQIVRDLLTFCGRPASTAATDLRGAVDFAARMAQNEIRHRAQLEVEVPAVRVEAQESSLGQVILNLLINAAQAIPEGNAQANRIRITARCEPDEVVVEVSDTGRGMDADTMRRAFDPFFTTKKVGQGTGLGLSICHRLVTDMGGQIVIESQLGGGTTARVTLRRAAGQALAAAAANATPQRRARVLVVDDEPAIARAIRRMLPECEVAATCRGSEAVAMSEGAPGYDLILCDMMMPDMSGMDVYEELHRRGGSARVAFLTGGAFTERARAFLASVPNPVLEKPVTAAQLRELIARI
jgi:PAS domain S-box-containing protein